MDSNNKYKLLTLENELLRKELALLKDRIIKHNEIHNHFVEDKLLKKNEIKDKEIFEAIFNNIPVMLTIYDPELKKFRFNEAFVKIMGWTEDDGNNENFINNVYPEPDYRKKVIEYMKSLESGWKEWNLTTKDGSKVDSIWANVLLSNGIQLGIGVDIRDRKKADEALMESEERFSTMFRSIPIGIILISGENKTIIDLNDAGLELFGAKHKIELLGKKILELDVIQSLDKKNIIMEFLEKGFVKSGEFQFVNLNGDARTMFIILNLIFINKKKHVLLTIMDITKRKQLEDVLQLKNSELSLAKKKAEEDNKLKSMFIANLSHEIKTPLTGILGFTELLKSCNLTDEKKNTYIKIIEKSGKRMLQIINELIDITRIEAKQVCVNFTETNIYKVLNELYNFFIPEANKKEISLKMNCNLPDIYQYVNTDELKLVQILTNLLKNAIKFTIKGNIEFGCEINDNKYLFFVKDTGAGISNEKIKVIFERFIQGDLNQSEKLEGIGLGLSISKTYVELLGGSIYVESELGKGSNFYFTLPLIVDYDEDYIKNCAKLINKRILIAEDDKGVFFLFSEILHQLKINTLHARDGFEVLEYLKSTDNIDLIIMDTEMPNLNGVEATKLIRKFNFKIPIIGLSGNSSELDKQKALEGGCNGYLVKPITRNSLINALIKYLK